MLELDIKVGRGAGHFSLGSAREEVRELMNKYGFSLEYETDRIDYFCENALQFEYKNGVVRFIGISDHAEIACTYHGADVFNMEAVALFKLIAQREPVMPLIEAGKTCFFPSQGINLWEADEQYDRKGGYKRRVYAQVGVEAPGEVEMPNK